MYVKVNPSSYSVAIYEIAKESNKIKTFHEQFSFVKKVIEKNPQLITFLKNDEIALEKRFELIDEIFGSLEVDVKNSIKVALVRNMIFVLRKIIVDFLKITNYELGIKFAKIITAYPLSDSELEKIQKKLNEKTKKIVEISTEVDEKLLSGYKIIFSNQLYERNYNNDLQKIKKMIIKGKEDEK